MRSRHLTLFLASLGLGGGCVDKSNDENREERVYVNDPPAYTDDSSSNHEGTADGADGAGGVTTELRLPFPSGEDWQMTRGYNTGSHTDYGYDWVDDSYALDFALGGCDSWRKPVTAVKSGTVEVVGWDEDGYGNYVLVDHGSGYKSRYAHFDETSVVSGQAVTNTTTVGLVGNTGYVSGTVCGDHPGTHLHLAYYFEGDGVAPEPMSGHTDFTAGCWYGHNGWIDCDGDDLDDNTGESEEDDTSGGAHGGEGEGEEEEEEPTSDCTWSVPDDVSDIQDAIDLAITGDTVCVEAGSYREDLTFTGEDIMVRGVDGADVTHVYGQATGSYESVVTVGSGESEVAVLEGFTLHPNLDARGMTVTLSGITLRNLAIVCGDVAQYGLFLDGATSVHVSNTWIEDCTSYGVYAPGATDIHLENLIVTGNGSAGIRVAGGGEIEVVNSVFYANGHMGVDVRQSNATVENSIVSGHDQYGLLLDDNTTTLTSSYNTFDDNAVSTSEHVRLGSGNTTEDPLFTNAVGEDFSLRSTSPCIDDGNPSSSYNDADGTRNDKGAYGGPTGESW